MWAGDGPRFAPALPMRRLTQKQADLIHGATDSVGLPRNAIIVPFPDSGPGRENSASGGTLVLCAPFAARFDTWFLGFPAKLLRRNPPQEPRTNPHESPRGWLSEGTEGTAAKVASSSCAISRPAIHALPSKEGEADPADEVEPPYDLGGEA